MLTFIFVVGWSLGSGIKLFYPIRVEAGMGLATDFPGDNMTVSAHGGQQGDDGGEKDRAELIGQLAIWEHSLWISSRMKVSFVGGRMKDAVSQAYKGIMQHTRMQGPQSPLPLPSAQKGVPRIKRAHWPSTILTNLKRLSPCERYQSPLNNPSIWMGQRRFGFEGYLIYPQTSTRFRCDCLGIIGSLSFAVAY